jgi:hypothetical protein
MQRFTAARHGPIIPFCATMLLKRDNTVPYFTQLSGEQTRQLLNTEQAYAAFRSARAEREERFRGSMAWKSVRGREYLYRKVRGDWKSLGRRNAETELIEERFREGRDAIKARIASLDQRIRRMAAINRAMGLGRVPWVAARLLRRLERMHLLGRAITIAGTQALFVYERLAGGHFHSSQLATEDIDLLYDARSRVRLLTTEQREQGLEGILRHVDPSFVPISRGAYRAVNDAGFIVDFITPLESNPAHSRPKRIGSKDEDMTAAEIAGLAWLQNCPRIHQTVIDERGFPLRLDVPDPRAFALHKLWLSERPDRDRAKARRDAAQARAVAALVTRFLPQLDFAGDDLRALPEALRARTAELVSSATGLLIEGASSDW